MSNQAYKDRPWIPLFLWENFSQFPTHFLTSFFGKLSPPLVPLPDLGKDTCKHYT